MSWNMYKQNKKRRIAPAQLLPLKTQKLKTFIAFQDWFRWGMFHKNKHIFLEIQLMYKYKIYMWATNMSHK